MRSFSSLSEDQREAAVAWFEKGVGYRSTARLLGGSLAPVKALHLRWRIHGLGVLVTKPTKSYSFEFKLALVERFIAGETAQDLAAEAGLSSSGLLKNWAAAYRREGADALRPKPKGRPGKPIPRRRRSCPSWNGCAGRTNGCGRKWPTWENYGP